MPIFTIILSSRTDLCTTSATALLYSMSCYIWWCYNITQLYVNVSSKHTTNYPKQWFRATHDYEPLGYVSCQHPHAHVSIPLFAIPWVWVSARGRRCDTRADCGCPVIEIAALTAKWAARETWILQHSAELEFDCMKLEFVIKIQE